MRSFIIVCLSGAVLAGSLVGCTSPQKRKAHAEARGAEARASMEEERLGMLKEYRECLRRYKAKEGAERCAHLKEGAGR